MKNNKIEKIIAKIRSAKAKGVEIAKREGLFVLMYKTLRLIKKKTVRRFFINGLIKQSNAEAKKIYEKKGKSVTIIIPSFNDYKVLRKCLQSIKKTTNQQKVRLIIVDDASTNEKHIKFLRNIKQKNIKIIFKEKNEGFAKTINRGLRESTKEDAVLLNSDTEARDGWLEALQFTAYQRKDIGIVGPKLLYPNNTIQYGGSHRNTDAPKWFDHYYRFKENNFPPANVPNYVIGITGACMYIKRKVVDKIGVLDENFSMAFEDMDYCIRAWREGFRSLYSPLATVIHHESVTRGKIQGKREVESLEYFWEKWKKWFDNRNVRDKNGKIRVIYVLQTTGVSGGHRIVFEHLNRLKEKGFSVELYNLEGPPKWFPLKVPVKTFKNYEKLIKSLEKEEAIKVATWWETAEPVWLSSVNNGVPAFFVQDVETTYYKDDVEAQSVVLSKYRKEFNYFTTSTVNERELLNMGLKPTIIPCGIDTKVFMPNGAKREKNTILSIGRSHYLKNLQMTLDAFNKIKGKKPMFWMFGIEPELARKNKGIKYFFRPEDREVNDLLNRATIFIQTSRHEGFCLPVLEAMAAGAPVICTNAHGNADFCIDGKNSLLVKHDDSTGLKNTIVNLLGDQTKQEKLREEGYKTADEYSWENVMSKLEKYYKMIDEKTRK